jgi:hypothetical protein
LGKVLAVKIKRFYEKAKAGMMRASTLLKLPTIFFGV